MLAHRASPNQRTLKEGRVADTHSIRVPVACLDCGCPCLVPKRGQMPKLCKACRASHYTKFYDRQCDYCGKAYRGTGKQFCSKSCATYHAQGPALTVTRNCKQCGLEFRVNDCRPKMFCSFECSCALRRKVYVCEVCGVDFNSRSHSAHRACSRECGFKLQRMDYQRNYSEPHDPWSHWWYRACGSCGVLVKCGVKVFNAKCSPKCQGCLQRARAEREAHRVVVTTTGACAECLQEFARQAIQKTARTTSRTLKFCSQKCAEDSHRRNHNHKVRMRGILQSKPDRLTFKDVWDKTGGKCHICGLQCRRFDPNVSLKASIEHIMPTSRGGGHTLSNLAIAHMVCNSFKGDSGHVTGRLRERCVAAVKALKAKNRNGSLLPIHAEPAKIPIR